MAKGKKRLRLKKHMAALVAQSEQEQETIIDLPLTAIRPNPYQPRRSFDKWRWRNWHSRFRLTGSSNQ